MERAARQCGGNIKDPCAKRGAATGVKERRQICAAYRKARGGVVLKGHCGAQKPRKGRLRCGIRAE